MGVKQARETILATGSRIGDILDMSDVQLSDRPTSLREKLAQLLFVRVGSNLPPVRTVEEDELRVTELIEQCPVGGLVLFNGRRGETAQTLARLQTQSRYPLLVASDIERGVGQHLLGHTVFPHAMAFDALGPDAEQAVQEFAEFTANSALANGIHIAFAPVADVNIDPRNPIIATRAFGSSPERVARLVKSFIEGCQNEGLLTTAKHFPGHGNTHEDSHLALPTVDASREEMLACELAPFRAAISANVSLIMTAHVRYPAWDESGKPATLSRPILTELLREQLGFDGVVVSDSLLMEGVKSQYANEGELAVEALLAGIDILCDLAEPVATLEALETAVAREDLPLQRVEESFRRVWALKQSVFSAPRREADIDTDDSARTTETMEGHSREVARKAIICQTNDSASRPLSSRRSLCALLLRPHGSHLDPPEQPLGAALRERFNACEYYELGPDCQSTEYDSFCKRALQADQLLIAFIVKPAAWHRFGLLPEQAALVKKLTESRECVLASLGTPEALHPFEATVKLCTFSDVAASQVALAEYILVAT